MPVSFVINDIKQLKQWTEVVEVLSVDKNISTIQGKVFYWCSPFIYCIYRTRIQIVHCPNITRFNDITFVAIFILKQSKEFNAVTQK